MRPRNVRIACLILIFTLVLLRSFALQQMYCFAMMEEAFRISRRNRRMLLMCMAVLSQQQRPQLKRRALAWVLPRPQNWFRLLIANPALHFLWKEHFRVTHATFEYLCDLVRADPQKQQTRMRAPISVEERVGLASWRLSTGNSYRSCGFQFGYDPCFCFAKKVCVHKLFPPFSWLTCYRFRVFW